MLTTLADAVPRCLGCQSRLGSYVPWQPAYMAGVLAPRAEDTVPFGKVLGVLKSGARWTVYPARGIGRRTSLCTKLIAAELRVPPVTRRSAGKRDFVLFFERVRGADGRPFRL